MSQTFEFYDARAKEAAEDAKKATLDNVRDRCLRAEKTWRGLATQASRVHLQRQRDAASKAERVRVERAEAEAARITTTAMPPQQG